MIFVPTNMFTSNRLVLLFCMLIFALILSRSTSGEIRCLENERQALLLFKDSLKDDYRFPSSWQTNDSGFLSSWQTDDCCEWKGVQCSNHTSHVISLHLSGGFFHTFGGKVGPSLLQLRHLTYLEISDFWFDGSANIPEFIVSLSKLKYLNLSNCGFFGVIPDQIGNFSNLQTLDLSYNHLGVRNLEWLSHLRSLRHLDLSGVNLDKAYDWSQAINKLAFLTELKLGSCGLPRTTTASLYLFNSSSTSLSILDLSSNPLGIELSRYRGLFNYSFTSIDLCSTGLFGQIPKDFEKMQFLEYLDLSENKLEGGIINSIGNLSSLRHLDLFFNRLNGTIPPSFGKLPKLEVLRLSSNQFQGTLPNFLPSLRLRELDLNDNELNGTIPQSMGNLSELESLDFSSNCLIGLLSEVHLQNLSKLWILDLSKNSLVLKFNSDWVPPFNLTIIGLRNCKMGPHFPSWFHGQQNLESIDISGSGIDDAIPNWFWDFSPELEELNMSNNALHGILPDLSLKLDYCYIFDLSSNNIEGPIPLLPANLAILDLSKNRFQGSILSLCNNSGFLDYVGLSHNLLSGRLPDCWMQLKQLSVLNLANNKFSGSIPSSIGQLRQIQALHLRNNSLEGELPPSLQQCTNLSVIDIGENKFVGEIPIWLGRSLPRLVILSLRSNQFNGRIPAEICHLKMIQILDFSVNNISGVIPKCLRNFTIMARKGSIDSRISIQVLVKGKSIMSENTFEEAASLVWKGIELEYGNTLGLVKSIDLASNKLTGEIPLEIAYLEGLVALNLSRNNLNGKVPPEIGLLLLLDFLDLSSNQLSGMIPKSFSKLHIGVLNLSNNNLSGKIPLSTQLQSFDASAFSQNSGLCGLPLPNLCPEDQGNFVPGSRQDSEIQEDERFINPGFYAALGIGFAVGLWGTLGSLLLNSSWRVAYFRLVANIQDSLYVTIVVNMGKVKRLLKK